jgi:hypothetical protein
MLEGNSVSNGQVAHSRFDSKNYISLIHFFVGVTSLTIGKIVHVTARAVERRKNLSQVF